MTASARHSVIQQAVRTEPITMFVGSWNLGDCVPPASLDGWISKEERHDIYAIATQESSDEHWLVALDSHLGPDYVRIAERRMGAIALVVFTHRRHATKITGVETSFLPTGVLGVGTNKGAVALAFCLRGVRLCVVNAHLAAHQDKLLQRNRNIQEITKHLRLGLTTLELPLQYHTIWCGDLNYRIDESRSEVLRLIEAEQWHQLYQKDQLATELSAERVLFGFTEAPLSFPPTYKYTRLTAAPIRRRPFGKMGLRSGGQGIKRGPSFPKGAGKGGGKGGGDSGGEGGGGGSGSVDETPMRSGGACVGGSPAAPRPSERLISRISGAFGTGGEVEDGGNGAPCGASPCGSGGGGTRFSTACDGSPASGVTAMAVSGGGQVGGISRKYDDEKHRVPSWCDRVLWRSLPGRLSLSSSGAAACDDPFFYASDHAPVSQILELELPVLPTELPLNHCTVYLSNLTLYRARPTRHAKTGIADPVALMGGVGANLTSARTAQGKGVPLPVAGNKLQNLPPQLTVYAHMLVLHRLMGDAAPIHAAALTQDGRGATNIVIGPMLAQKEFLALQQLQLRVVSLSGGKPTELGQAVFILDAAASGRPYDFDVTVERMTVPAGFNIRGTVNVVWTKTLGDEHFQTASMSSSGREKDRGLTSGRSRKHDLSAPFTRSGTGLGSRRWSCGSSTPPGRLSEEGEAPSPASIAPGLPSAIGRTVSDAV